MSQETPVPPAPHVLLVSAPLQGHVNPLLCLGQRLASRGLLVTFTTAPHAGLKLDHGGTLRFEHLQGGGLWAPDDPRYRVPDDLARNMENAAPAALAGLVRRQADAGRPVSFVVANAFAPWAVGVAVSMGVPRAVLWTQSCAVLSLYYHYFHSLAAFPPAAESDATVAVPGLPELAAGELPALIYAPEQYVWRQALAADLRGLRETPSWVLVNTFDELEHPAVEALRAHLPAVVPVGPLFEADDHVGDDCTAWLDAQPPRSVVFVAFGSLVTLGHDETAEVAAGLASTGRPFLWVVRDDSVDGNGLVAASSASGKVVPWCTQRRVLAHGAVGCFVTHCGWNSTTEALAAGVPVVAYPSWSDQRTNAKFLVDVYGVGVRLPVPPTRDALRRCVDEVMNGPEAGAMRVKAAKWKAQASAAAAHGGSSEKGIQDFVDTMLYTTTPGSCPGEISRDLSVGISIDAQPPRSVAFVAFGSLVNTGDDETAEIAAGLAGSGRPFLWVLRDENPALLSQDALDGVMASCRGGGGDRGSSKVAPWCDQVRVLAHGAVGCFVTHCGWNSAAKALAAGVPVVACPRWSDQRINAKFLADVHRVGVRAPTPLTREALRRCVEEAMREPEAEAMGLRAASWKVRACAAVADGGSSGLSVQAFVDQKRSA